MWSLNSQIGTSKADNESMKVTSSHTCVEDEEISISSSRQIKVKERNITRELVMKRTMRTRKAVFDVFITQERLF
jgi:hypothetical protein